MATARPATPGYGAPAPYAAGDLSEPAVYTYKYGVADDYSGAAFGQDESRDGYSTSGSYRVALPDGRTQVVTYHTADAYSGNIAEVTYEGEAHYDAVKPVVHATPAYHAPVVHAAPAYHAPVVHAPVYHAAPVVKSPVYYAAPVYHAAPVPVYHG